MHSVLLILPKENNMWIRIVSNRVNVNVKGQAIKRLKKQTAAQMKSVVHFNWTEYRVPSGRLEQHVQSFLNK